MVEWDAEPLTWDDPHGLVYIGGDLEPSTLLGAYRRGIFPWFNEDDPYLWWSPEPRAIFSFETLHFSRRLLRTVRQQRFTITINQAFPQVMEECAQRPEGTWITQDMYDAYCYLHQLGHAHSMEAWQGNDLVGGIYGVAVGGLFAAESMFHRQTDAGMVTFVALARRLKERGFVLFDTQMATDHTRKLGAVDVSRMQYLQLLDAALGLAVDFA